MSEPFVLINAFEVAPEDDDAFLRGWNAAREYLEGQPGYIATTLHRAVTPGAEFRFVNVAQWESPALFQQTIQSDEFRAAAAPLSVFRAHPALYEVVS